MNDEKHNHLMQEKKEMEASHRAIAKLMATKDTEIESLLVSKTKYIMYIVKV